MTEKRPRLCIVSGPSSAGKSTLIASPRGPELTGLSADAPVLFPPKLRQMKALEADSYLHYNLLRPRHRAWKKGESLDGKGFARDPRWSDALGFDAERSAVILIVDRETLLERVGARLEVEPELDAEYQAEAWQEVYRDLDLEALYAEWRDELRANAIPWVEVDASSDSYEIVGQG